MRFCSIRHFRSQPEREVIRSGTMERLTSPISTSRDVRRLEIEVDKGRLFGLKAYSKSLKRFIKVAVWYPDEEDRTKWQIYFTLQPAPQVIDKLFKELVLFTARAA